MINIEKRRAYLLAYRKTAKYRAYHNAYQRTEKYKAWARKRKQERGGYAIELRYRMSSPKAFLVRLYRNMKSRVTGVQKKKAHLYFGKELLDKHLFYEWALAHPQFHALRENWIRSDYDRKLTPTVNRINLLLGYVLENMEWITHSENSKKTSQWKKI